MFSKSIPNYINTIKNIRYVGKNAGFKLIDVHYSKAVGCNCHNHFTGFVYVQDGVQFPIYQFEYGNHGFYFNRPDDGMTFVNILPNGGEPVLSSNVND